MTYDPASYPAPPEDPNAPRCSKCGCSDCDLSATIIVGQTAMWRAVAKCIAAQQRRAVAR